MSLATAQVREYRPDDEERIVALSLRAWTPVFSSIEAVIGGQIFGRLYEDWRESQERDVRAVLTQDGVRVWVAERAGGVVGFVTAAVAGDGSQIGEITMLAVDPDAQNEGIGTVLTDFAAGWLRCSGMRVAVVETGGDPGHAPARRAYEKAGFTKLPIARYFRAL